MEWTDEGIVLGIAPPRRGERHPRADDARAWPPSRAGAGRGGLAACGRCCSPAISCSATWRARLDEHLGHYAVEGLRLRAGDLFLAAPHARLRRDASRGALPAPARARSAPADARRARRDARASRRSGARRGAGRALRAADAGRTRLRARSRQLRRDRRDRRSHLCLAEVRARGVARAPASRGSDRLLRLPAFLGARAGMRRRRRTTRRRLCCSPAFSWRGMCSSRAGLRCPMPAQLRRGDRSTSDHDASPINAVGPPSAIAALCRFIVRRLARYPCHGQATDSPPGRRRSKRLRCARRSRSAISPTRCRRSWVARCPMRATA